MKDPRMFSQQSGKGILNNSNQAFECGNRQLFFNMINSILSPIFIINYKILL